MKAPRNFPLSNGDRHPASTRAIRSRPAARLCGPPSATNAAASAARDAAVPSQIASPLRPVAQPAQIVSSIAARYIRIVHPPPGVLIVLQAIGARIAPALALAARKGQQQRHEDPAERGHRAAEAGG